MRRIDENHSFNINVCQVLGGKLSGAMKAVLLKELYGWCHINSSKQKNVKFGVPWSYMSSESFADKFPYMTPSSIRRWLGELEKDGWIYSGNFNKKGFDKTKWYTVNFDSYDYAVQSILTSIDQRNQWIDFIKRSIDQNGQPIPSTNKTTNTSFKENKEKEKEKAPSLFSNIEEPKETPKSKKSKNIPQFKEIIEYFKKTTGRQIRIAKTEAAIIKSEKYTFINARLNDGYTIEECKMVIKFIYNLWKDSFKMKHHIVIPTIFRPKNFEKYLDSALNQNLGPQTDKKKEKDNPATGFSLDNIQVNS